MLSVRLNSCLSSCHPILSPILLSLPSFIGIMPFLFSCFATSLPPSLPLSLHLPPPPSLPLYRVPYLLFTTQRTIERLFLNGSTTSEVISRPAQFQIQKIDYHYRSVQMCMHHCSKQSSMNIHTTYIVHAHLPMYPKQYHCIYIYSGTPHSGHP